MHSQKTAAAVRYLVRGLAREPEHASSRPKISMALLASFNVDASTLFYLKLIRRELSLEFMLCRAEFTACYSQVMNKFMRPGSQVANTFKDISFLGNIIKPV
jgi:uncharacterized protein (DUF2236 family)